MANGKTTITSSGCSFAGLLTILFIGLKLTGNIAWSWWWVLSPILISWGLGLTILGLGALAVFCAYMADKK